jgi:hypothetical protein
VSRALVVCTRCDWAREVEDPTELPGLFAAHCPDCGDWLDLGELFDGAPSMGSAG